MSPEEKSLTTRNRSKVLARRINAALVVEAMTFFERGYLTRKFH